MWADLLALAGFSRFPGIVCSGETNGVLEPYPMDYLCSVFRCDDSNARDALKLFEQQGRIAINETGVIQIVNWEKYQSEYQQKRQRRRYGEPARSDSGANVRTKSVKTPTEEVEVEGDLEGEKKHLTAHTPRLVTAIDFNTFWKAWHLERKVGKKQAFKAWRTMTIQDQEAAIAGIWKVANRDPQFIPHPSTYLNARRWEDESPNREIGFTEASVGRGPQAGFGSCKSCGERFTTHSQACNHECEAK